MTGRLFLAELSLLNPVEEILFLKRRRMSQIWLTAVSDEKIIESSEDENAKSAEILWFYPTTFGSFIICCLP
jgi:hypothetical protein